jgi:hypothetical protein
VDGSSTGIEMYQNMVFLEIAEWRLLAQSGHLMQCGIMSAFGGKADMGFAAQNVCF